MNNRPIAVLLNIDEYEEHFSKPQLIELEHDQVGAGLRKKAMRAAKSKKSDLVNL